MTDSLAPNADAATAKEPLPLGIDRADIQPIGMFEPLSVGDVVLVRMRVTKAEPANDYRGLHYIMCADPWDSTEAPIPVLRMDVVARDTPSDGAS